ncbi:MAG: Ig-like domain-containing protein [Pirellula sp.]
MAATSAQPHEIEFAPDNSFAFLRADGTGTSWRIGVTDVLASSLTLAQAYQVEDRILHYVDKLNPTHALTFGPYKGFVDIQVNKAFITDQTDSGLLGDGSIQRGIDAVAVGGTVNVEAGTYVENLTISKDVDVIGAVDGLGVATTTLTPATGGNLVTLTGTGFGDDETVKLTNFNFDGLAGLAGTGVFVGSATDFASLQVNNGSFTGFSVNGVGVFGNSVTGDSVDSVSLSNLAFSNNGISGTGGTGDVNFFEYNNAVNLTNVTMVGNRNEGAGTGGRLAIQLRGVGDGTGTGTLPSGTIVLNNVDISGKYRNQMIGIQRYADVDALSFSNVKLGGATSEITGSFGASLRFDAVGTGTLATPETVNLGNTLFRGLAPTSAQPHEIEFAPDNSFAFLRADGTGTSWRIGVTDVLASSLTLAQAYQVEDRILHYVDKLNPTHALTFGPYKGFVDIQVNKAFITDQTDSGLLGDGSIQRGIDAVAVGGTVNVEAGTYFEDITINKGVSVLGSNSGISAQSGIRVAESIIHPVADSSFNNVVVAVTADNVKLGGFRVIVDRAHASGGIAASYGAINDISNLTGGSFDNLQVLNNFVESTGLNVGDFDLDPVSSLPATSMGIALIGMGSPVLNTVTVQGNQVLATPELGDPAGVSAFTRGIYLGQVEGAIGGATIALGNTSTGFAWDLLVQFAAGPTTVGNNRFIGAGVDISAPNATVTVSENTFAPEVLITSPVVFPTQSLAIRTGTATVFVNSNTFDDFHRGIVVYNGGKATLSGNNFENEKVPFISDTNGIGESAIRVEAGALASVINNTFGDGVVTGVDVDGGIAKVQGNMFANQDIGVLIRNAGRADLGQLPGGTEISSGLGVSTGGNNFVAFTTAASPTQGAVVVLKNNAPNNLPGVQGLFNDTPAYGNVFNNSASIATVIYDDADDSTRGLVLISPVIGNLFAGPIGVVEGGSVTLTGTIINSGYGTPFDIEVNWGNGITIETVTAPMITAGVFSFTHVYKDDNPSGSSTDVYSITAKVVGGATAPVSPGFVFVSNLVPSITGLAPITGSAGVPVSIAGSMVDPGVEDTFQMMVNWGDGLTEMYQFAASMTGTINLATAIPIGGSGPITHTYTDVDPATTTNYSVVLTLRDDDGGTAFAVASASISNTNDPPVAVNDFFGTSVNSLLTIGVLGNDIDADGPALSITHVNGSPVSNGNNISLSFGTLSVASVTGVTNFNFIPSGTAGTQTFEYTMTDGFLSSTATVSILIAGTNGSPDAKNDVYGVPANVAVPLVLEGSTLSGNVITNIYTSGADMDPDNDTLTTVLQTAPSNGSVVLLANGSFIYTPSANFAGTDTFVYRLLDGRGGLDEGTVAVTVTNVNDAPSGTDKTIMLTRAPDVAPVDYVLTAADFGFSDSLDTPANILDSVKITTVPTAGSLTLSGGPVLAGTIIAVADITGGNLKFAPATNGFGVSYASFDFQVRDDGGVLNGGVVEDPTPNKISFNVNSSDETGPRVTSVRVNSTAWSDVFRDFADGGFVDPTAFGYVVPTGNNSQAATLPWVNMNQILVQFNENVSASLDVGDFRLTSSIAGITADGSTAVIPTINNVQYINGSNVAVLTLSRSLDASTIILEVLSGGVRDVSGNSLDGEWTNDVSTLSGNGAIGGDFSFRMHVLPGKAVQVVPNVDYSNTTVIVSVENPFIVAAQSGVLTVDMGVPIHELPYTIFADLNGSGESVDVFDVALMRTRSGSRLLKP